MTATLTNVAKPSQRRQFVALRAFIQQMASIPQETQEHFAKVKRAHEVQAEFARLPQDAQGDLGMSADDILSVPSYSEDLPFFMQAAYGRRG